MSMEEFHRRSRIQLKKQDCQHRHLGIFQEGNTTIHPCRASVVGSSTVKVPSCRVDGCHVSLSSFRRKYRVCEIHCKAPSVIVQGLAQRFCQTCSRFHVVSEFDGKKRSCRRTLAERNEKRRKSLQDFDSGNASKSSAILPDPPAPNSSPECGTLLDPPEPRCDENLNLPSPDAQSEEEP